MSVFFTNDFSDNSVLPTEYPLTYCQHQQLSAIKDLFPNFEKQGLGKTALLQHKIDIGSADPVKQRHYPVSPAVGKLMYQEIDRMLLWE